MGYLCIVESSMLSFVADKGKLQSIRSEQAFVNDKIKHVELLLKKDTQQKINAEIDRLKANLFSLDQRLATSSTPLIAAKKMPSVLYNILSKNPKLTVKYLKSLPVESFSIETDRGSQQLYKHSLEIQLVGRDKDLYQYLQRLEGLNTKLYWLSLSYQVTKPPLAAITLQIYTLSESQDFIRS